MEERYQEVEDDFGFDEGFNLNAGEDAGEAAGEEAGPVAENEVDAQVKPAGHEPEDAPLGQPEAEQAEEMPFGQPKAELALDEDAPEQTIAEPEQKQPAMLAEEPEAIREELARLRELSPEAARLAMEDSAEGKAIRSRLENFGAEVAQDRAEATLEKRQRQSSFEKQERARIEAHNRGFLGYMKQNAPEHYSLITDPKRQAEKARYLQNVFEWIETKPFREARAMMEVAQRGRDPEQVCNLLKRYERERRGSRPDATGALAVPSRGAVAQAGIGDADDFDAGWNLNRD